MFSVFVKNRRKFSKAVAEEVFLGEIFLLDWIFVNEPVLSGRFHNTFLWYF